MKVLFPQDDGSFAFTFEGVTITDPFRSSCGRFEYDPADPSTESIPRGYGFERRVHETLGYVTWSQTFESRLGKPVVVEFSPNTTKEIDVTPSTDLFVEVIYQETEETVCTWLRLREAFDDDGNEIAAQDLSIDAPALYDSLRQEPDVEAALCMILTEFCARNRLEPRSADEMLAELHGKADPRVESFLMSFITVWDEMIQRTNPIARRTA